MFTIQRFWRFRYGFWILALLLLAGEWVAFNWIIEHGTMSYKLIIIGAGRWLLAIQSVFITVAFFSFLQPAGSHYRLFCSGCEITYVFATLSPPEAGSVIGQIASSAQKPSGTLQNPDIISRHDTAPDIHYVRITDSSVRAIVANPERQYWRCMQCDAQNRYPSTNIEAFLLIERVGFCLMLAGVAAVIAGFRMFEMGVWGIIGGSILATLPLLGLYMQEQGPRLFSKVLTAYELDHVASSTSYTLLSGVHEQLAEYAIAKDPTGLLTQRSRRIVAESLRRSEINKRR